MRQPRHVYHDLEAELAREFPSSVPFLPANRGHRRMFSGSISNLRVSERPSRHGSEAPNSAGQAQAHTSDFLVENMRQLNLDTPFFTSSVSGAQDAIPIIPHERNAAQLAVTDGKFYTFEQANPPPTDAIYEVEDQGVSGPDFMRLSMYNLPSNKKLYQKLKLPLGIVVTPFPSTEIPVAVIPEGQAPPRCQRCLGYVNPGTVWKKEGWKFLCNLCQSQNDTPDWYYQPTTVEGKRVDWDSRPELAAGTYEFELPKNMPGYGGSGSPLRHIFVVDASVESVKRGILDTIMLGLQNLFQTTKFVHEFALITFTSNIQVFRFNGNAPEMLVISECDDDFPLPPDVFFKPENVAECLNNFFKQRTEIFGANNAPGSCYGSALKLAIETLGENGGRVSCFSASLPTSGPGALTARNQMDPSISTSGVTDSLGQCPKELFIPTSKFYCSLAETALNSHVICDLMAFPLGYMDIANQGILAARTGGAHHLYNGFVLARDFEVFFQDLWQLAQHDLCTRECLVKVRLPMGLQVEKYWGLGDAHGQTSSIGLGHSFAVTFEYDDVLNDRVDAHFQAAIAYTDDLGIRKIRVLNLPAGVTHEFKSVVKFLDTDAIMGIMARQALHKREELDTKAICRAIKEKCHEVFGAMRLYSGSSMPPSQLLMPTTLRQFLAMSLALTKSIPLGTFPGSADLRTHIARKLEKACPEVLSLLLYPRIYSLFDLMALDTEEIANNFSLPTLRASEFLLTDGPYMFYNGKMVYIYVTAGSSPRLIKDLFGVEEVSDIDPYLTDLPILDTVASTKTRALYSMLCQRAKRGWLPLRIARYEYDGSEKFVQLMLVEDELGQITYNNFLTLVHNEAQKYKDKGGNSDW